MKSRLLTLAFAFGALFAGAPGAFAQSDALDRSVLPIPEPPAPFSTVLDARDAKPPPRFEVKAPEGAPNVLIVILDDMGFGQSSAFGGRSTCRPSRRSPTTGCATTSFTQPRSARRHA